jgi:hypothetical protein
VQRRKRLAYFSCEAGSDSTHSQETSMTSFTSSTAPAPTPARPPTPFVRFLLALASCRVEVDEPRDAVRLWEVGVAMVVVRGGVEVRRGITRGGRGAGGGKRSEGHATPLQMCSEFTVAFIVNRCKPNRFVDRVERVSSLFQARKGGRGEVDDDGMGGVERSMKSAQRKLLLPLRGRIACLSCCSELMESKSRHASLPKPAPSTTSGRPKHPAILLVALINTPSASN